MLNVAVLLTKGQHQQNGFNFQAVHTIVARYFEDLALRDNVAISPASAWLSCLLPAFRMVRRPVDSMLFYCLEPAKWGALCLGVRTVHDEPRLYAIKDDVTWLHVTTITDGWSVLSTESCTPRHISLRYPGLSHHGILFRENCEEASLLKHMLQRKITLSVEKLLCLGELLGLLVTRAMLRVKIIVCDALRYRDYCQIRVR